MPTPSGWFRSLSLITCAFAGGAIFAQLANATPQSHSPYAPFQQLARALVIVENEYVEPAQRNKLIEGAIKGMVAELDPHSAYMSREEFTQFFEDMQGRFTGIGVEVDYKDDYVTVLAAIEGSPAERAGIQSGDQIVAVNGRPTRGERIETLAKLLRGASGTSVKVTIRRANVAEPITFNLVRGEVRIISVVSKRLDNNIGYIRLRQFHEATYEELLRAAATLRAASKTPLTGVILDMRNNPGGDVSVAEAVADEFLSSGSIYSTRDRNRVVDEAKAHAGGAFATLPVVVLVNEYSASAAELVAGALQDNKRATLVGATTFGKGSVQTIYDLPDGAGIRLTTMRYYTPNGRSIQAQGVRPDILIEGTKTAGADGVLREQDLEGHLPAEGNTQSTQTAVVVNQTPTTSSDSSEGTGRDTPSDPTNGTDFALSVGYQTLLNKMSRDHQ